MELLKKKAKGFTLIELLVVIAIIGILSSIVLVSVNTARNKAKDAAIKGSIETIRSAAELAYDTTGDYNSVCVEVGDVAGNSTLGGGDFARINTAVYGQNGVNTFCNEAPSSINYAAWAPLVATPSTFFCVDSAGVAKQLSAVPAVNSYACP